MLDIEEYNEYARSALPFYNDEDESISDMFEILDAYNNSGICSKYTSENVRYTNISTLSTQDVLSSNSLIIDLNFSQDTFSVLESLNTKNEHSQSEDFPANEKSLPKITRYLEDLGNNHTIAEKTAHIILNIANSVEKKPCGTPIITCRDFLIELSTHSSSSPSEDSSIHVDGFMTDALFHSKVRPLNFLTTLKGNGTVIYDKPVAGHSFQSEYEGPPNTHATKINVTQSLIHSAINTSVSQATIHTSCCNHNMSIHSGPQYSSERLLMSMSFSIFH